MTDVAGARALLGAHDPISQRLDELDDLAVERIWQDLTRRVESGDPPSVRGPVRRDPRTVRSAVASIVVLALVAVGVAIAAGGGHSARRYVVLQPLDYSRALNPVRAAPVLDQLAAAAQAEPAAGHGSWYYLESASWSTFAGGDPDAQPAGMPTVSEQWIRGDGAQRVVTHSDLPAPAAGLDAWLRAGLPLTGGRVQIHTGAAAAGQFPAELSTDPTTLANELLKAEVGSSSPSTGAGLPRSEELIVAVKDLRAQRQMTPALQAAVLRMLAAQPSIVSVGSATDRLGRVVQAVALDSAASGLPTRHVLLFDQTTGELLGAEDILTKSAGELGVPIPSVISYVIYVRDGLVTSNTSVPPPL
jgi:hypothetical protein